MTYIVTVFIIVVDQIIKNVIINNFYVGESFSIIPGIFHLTYVKNRGAGFGVLQGYRSLFIYITLIIITGLLIYRRNVKKNFYLDLATGLILGGAVGNLIDRVHLGYVVDYLDFKIWPVFNLADSMLVIGSGILFIYLWRFTGDNNDQ